MYIFYDLIYFFLLIFYFLPRFFIEKKYHTRLSQRLGFFSPVLLKKLKGYEVLWIHAVSVGEAMLAHQLEKKLYSTLQGEFKVVISTTTATGQKIARKKSNNDTVVVYFPLDLSLIVRHAFNLIDPSLIVLMETELWPNVIAQASKKGIPVVMANGRISEGSYYGYKIIKPILIKIFKHVNLFCMQSSEDAIRVIDLGADKKKVKICGNMKFDRIERTLPNPKIRRIKRWLDYEEEDKVFVCGSTHPGEEEIILDVYNDLLEEGYGFKLVVVPRHVNRRIEIKKLLKKRGYNYSFFSNPSCDEKDLIYVMDKIGWLKSLYSISTLNFIGGSLKDYGGHNIIEPSLYSKPIVFGRYMSNFRIIALQFLKHHAAIQVKNKRQLFSSCKRLLDDLSLRKNLGKNAYKVLKDNQGTTDKIINHIIPFVTKKNEN